MGKRIHWFLLILIGALGLGAMLYFGMQPRPENRIRIREFSSPAMVAEALVAELRLELRKNPLLFLGIEVDEPEHVEIVREFLAQNKEADLAYEVVVIDQGFENKDFRDAVSISTRDDFENFIEGTEKALNQGKRVAVIVPTVFSSHSVPLNLAASYEQRTFRSPLSLSITDFPRTRESEKDMRYPCVVQGVDQTGLGPFGCMIATISRAHYRRKFNSQARVGILNQIDAKDFLFLYTFEK